MCLAGCSQHPAVCFFVVRRPMSKRFERSHLSPQAPFQYSVDFYLPDNLLDLATHSVPSSFLPSSLPWIAVRFWCYERLTLLLHTPYVREVSGLSRVKTYTEVVYAAVIPRSFYHAEPLLQLDWLSSWVRSLVEPSIDQYHSSIIRLRCQILHC